MRPFRSCYPVTAPERFADEAEEMAAANARARARQRALTSPIRAIPKARLAPTEARLAAYYKYRDHPLFGTLVQPARSAEGGWISDDDVFWDLVARETMLIKRDLLRTQFNKTVTR